MVYHWIKPLIYTLQQQCLLCQCAIAETTAIFGLCKDCYQAMPAAEPCCRRCGLPTAISVDACGQCLQKPPPFDCTVLCTPYNPDVQQLIYRLKQQHDMAACRLLADWLARQINTEPVPLDVLLPVPMHWQRQLWLGNNHSQLLAQSLARRLRIPCQKHWLKKQRKTLPQRGLSAAQRRRNLRHAFSVTGDVRGQCIGIVDDVMTTGSTMNTLAGILKKAGAKAVYALVIARA